jgi:hypothetical protein
MKNNKWKKVDLSIKDLSLWDENARFSDQYFNLPEEELLKYFLSDKFQVLKLAGEIEKDADLPQLEKIVVWHFDGRNTVLEGNRRVAAYKLMANPKLAGSQESKFAKIGLKIGIFEEFLVECLVTEDLEQGYRFIERKHLNKNNEVSWGSNEIAHHKERRGKAGEKELIRVGITKVVNGLDIANELKEAVLGPGYVTTFWRLIGQTPAQQFFGFFFDSDKKLKIKNSAFPKKLKVIVWDVLKNGQHNGKLFSRLNNKEIFNYLHGISEQNYDLVSREIKEAESKKQKNLFGQEKINLDYVLRIRKTPITKEVNELFGRTLALELGKVNDLYRALADVDKKSQGNDAILPFLGMALRLLVEIAARLYYENQDDGKKAKKDQVCEIFLKEAKKKLKQQQKNDISLINEWLSDQRNLGVILDKYAHGNIICKRADILKDSCIIADILDFYFGKKTQS